MPHLSEPNATLEHTSSVAFDLFNCGIWFAKMWHFKSFSIENIQVFQYNSLPLPYYYYRLSILLNL